MEPKFVALDPLTLVGMKLRVKPGSNAPSQLWGALGPRTGEIQHITRPDLAYGLSDNMNQATGEFDYFAGYQVSKANNVPEGMVAVEVPALAYAVFPCTIPTIQETYQQIYGVWLHGSGYQRTAGPDLEVYGESFDPRNPESVFEVYVPVTKG